LAALGLPLRPPKTPGVRVINNATPLRVEPANGGAGGWTVTPL
jgi:hypothetical protein